jgi:uncharacterized protein (TIGR03067 family)
MKKLLPVLCVVLLLGADKKDDGKKDAEKLQGKWVVKSVERGGQAVDLDKEEHVPQALTFKDDKITVAIKGGNKHEGTFKLGRDGKLGTLDLTPEEEDKKDRVIKALYRLDGDKLTVCVNEGKQGDRPKEIAAKEGSHCMVAVFTREKAK